MRHDAPEDQGPYFVDEALNRSDIRASKDRSGLQPGAPLALTMYVFDRTADCAPVAGRRSTSGTRTPPASTPTSPRTARTR